MVAQQAIEQNITFVILWHFTPSVVTIIHFQSHFPVHYKKGRVSLASTQHEQIGISMMLCSSQQSDAPSLYTWILMYRYIILRDCWLSFMPAVTPLPTHLHTVCLAQTLYKHCVLVHSERLLVNLVDDRGNQKVYLCKCKSASNDRHVYLFRVE